MNIRNISTKEVHASKYGWRIDIELQHYVRVDCGRTFTRLVARNTFDHVTCKNCLKVK